MQTNVWRYVEEQSSLAILFETKKFNCVSSTVLYYILCTRLGLKLELLEFPGSQFTIGHVMAIFVDSERLIDVETTNIDGFDIRRKIAEGGGYSLSIMNIKMPRKLMGEASFAVSMVIVLPNAMKLAAGLTH